ncbi:MAG: hypothetical protein QOG63_683 [Thermoleophilaceae bacterium]|nr:hypothetical protein [Thermoleophilaceae bacterium]
MIGGTPKVFISYRREETAGHAGRIYDVMSSHFGDSNVFMDVDIAPGVDFVKQITDYVGGCHVLLVVMGPHWATISNGGTVPRIAQPGDFVRLEVESALRRRDVTVIPVLVGGARMPDPARLPPELRPLARRNAIELSDVRWRYDIDRLLMTLDSLLAGTSAVHRVVLPAQRRRPESLSPVALVLGATLIAALSGGVGRALAQAVTTDDPQGKVGRLVDQAASRGLTWAVVGAAVAIWLTAGLRNGGLASRLLMSVFLGGLAGVAAAAVASGPKYLIDPRPEAATLDALGVAGVIVVGALVGALVGRLWDRHGSAGLVAGVVAGAAVGFILQAGGAENATAMGRVLISGFNAAVIVGFVTLTRALLGERAAQRISTGVPTGVRL